MADQALYKYTLPVYANPLNEAAVHAVVTQARVAGWDITAESQYRGWWTRIYLITARHVTREQWQTFRRRLEAA